MTIAADRLPERMRAAFIRATGGVDAIEVGELPLPQPGPTDVLVRMQASSVNHVDLFVRSGAYRTHTPFPFVIGRDLVGAVVAVGAGVDNFAIGDLVWCNSLGHDGRQGAYAEYAVVAAERLYRLPAGVPPQAAAAVAHTAATAYLGLVREARASAGQTLFLEGGGGGVGGAVLQMAKAMRLHIVTTAAADDQSWCLALGADAAFDYRRPDLYDAVRQACPDGVDLWWDASGHNRFAQCLPLLNCKARIVLMSGLKGRDAELPVGALYTRDITLCGFAISNASVADLACAARATNRLLAAGNLQSRIGATFHLSEAARAQEAMASGRIRGRIIVLP